MVNSKGNLQFLLSCLERLGRKHGALGFLRREESCLQLGVGGAEHVTVARHTLAVKDLGQVVHTNNATTRYQY